MYHIFRLNAFINTPSLCMTTEQTPCTGEGQAMQLKALGVFWGSRINLKHLFMGFEHIYKHL